jgi:hypothetical protein
MRKFIGRDLISRLLCISAIYSADCSADVIGSSSGHAIKIDSGVIFPKKTSAAVGVCKSLSSCWTPNSQDIKIMEKDLALFLETSKLMGSSEIFPNLASYKRKYYGFKRAGTRYIQVNGLCKRYWKPTSSNFSSPNRLMTDMGPCYFLVDYKVERHAFSDFYIDGD